MNDDGREVPELGDSFSGIGAPGQPPPDLRAAALAAADAAHRRSTLVESIVPSHDPHQIGHYQIVQRIGEGGMGIVYLAEQRHPVRRKVALKVIKLGMDSREVVARFEAERQALAMMSHPNVAAVFDAGITETGRPFFAMEHVPGVPLTQYCDENRLSTRRRLELFAQVCHAVQHAHQKGIIHRDLKPSNVLVTLLDGRPVPKVIDFGIAKAAHQPLTAQTLFTRAGSMIGTPEYMSPEQAQSTGFDVDTRTDIYSLGVVLYELLTGMTPFDSGAMRVAGIEAIARMIRDVDPPKPSTRLTDAEGGASRSATAADVARRHGTDIRTLRREIRGDLDWIVLKAIEKDRTRRYETADALAADVRRHLADEPVLARPPSAAYRLRKFARRHKAGMSAAGMAAAALLVGLVGVTYGLLRARTERDNALHARAAETSQRQAAEAVNDFLQQMLGSADPNLPLGKDVTVRQVLDMAAEKVDQGSLRDQPAIEATVRGTLGRTYAQVGQVRLAEAHLRTALEIRRRLYGEEHKDIAESLNDLGQLLSDKSFRRDEAEDLLRRALSMRRKLLGNDHLDVATSLVNLGFLMSQRDNEPAAGQMYREALAIRRAHLGPSHPQVAAAGRLLARAVKAGGELAEAESLLRDALKIQEGSGGGESLEVSRVLVELGDVLCARHDLDAAERALRRALAVRRRLLGDDGAQVGKAAVALGDVLVERGGDKLSEAESLYREAVNLIGKELGVSDSDVVFVIERLTDLLRERGDPAAAEALIREQMARVDADPAARQQVRGWCRDELGRHLQLIGRAAEAEPLSRSGLALRRASARTPGLAWSMAMFVPVLLDLRKYDEAAALARELPSALPQFYFELPWAMGEAKLLLGSALLGQGKAAEAEPLLSEGDAQMFGMPHRELYRKRDILRRLVKLYEERSDPATAAAWQAKLKALAPRGTETSTTSVDGDVQSIASC
jgi:serine/threonine protein kinase/Tfp pilus assembly protein PilF